MKNLLYKELKLALHPTAIIFLSFGAMLLIPQYCYYVAFIYTCLAIFFIFLTGRENNDITFTVNLPVCKRDVVKSRCIIIACLQLLQIIIAIPFAVITNIINPFGQNPAGINANPALFGSVFIMFTIFNLLFIPSFYKTAYNVGKAFIISGISVMFYIVVAEAIAQYISSPVSKFIDSTATVDIVKQVPIAIIGLIIWLGAWLFILKKSIKNFEKVDL